MSVYEYFTKMESICIGLAMAGYEVPQDDLILYILTGLPVENDVVVTLITNRAQT